MQTKSERRGGRTPVADYDVYEVDVETGRETRLTQFKFYQISNPYYFPDDKTFIFEGRDLPPFLIRELITEYFPRRYRKDV